MRGLLRILIFAFVLPSAGCLEFLDTKTLFGISEGTKISVTFDKAAGNYNPLPTSIDVTFPSTVVISSVTSSNFTLTETCTGSDPNIFNVSFAGQVATVSIANVGGCANGENYKLKIIYDNIEMTNDKIGEGSGTFTYTYDTSPPTVTISVKTVSGIVATSSYSFSSIVTSVTYAFSSDIDMSSISTATFSINSTGGFDCFTMPTVGSVSKNTSTSKVTVNLTGGVCNDGESFQISLAQDAVSDLTKDGTTGASVAQTGPAAAIDLNLSVDSSGVSVVDVGAGSTTADGTYGIGSTIDIEVSFDANVDVTGTPRLKLNTSPVRYATYLSGTGTTILVFRYTVQYGDAEADLDYASTTALELNGGTITKTASGGAIAATRTLASPGALGSLGDNRSIVIDTAVPAVTATSPTGTTNQWGQSARTVTYTMSEEIDVGSLNDSDLVISGSTCATPPTVVTSYLTGASNNVINFDLSTTACSDNQVYTLTFDPTDVDDLSANPGYGTAKVLTVTVKTTLPTISVSAPSKAQVNAAGNVKYTLTYSGATSVTLADGDVNLAGASSNCVPVVSGTGTASRTITITGCDGDGSVQMDIATDTAINAFGNYAAAVAEAAITDFDADNTELPDPTLSLPIPVADPIYNRDTLNNFTLTFAGDSLGASAAIQAALTLQCDSGGGPNPVSQTTSRSSNTVATVSPNEASPDFVYGATCDISGVDVPDAAGNLHTFAGLPFKVGKSLAPVSGPTGTISIAAATSAGDLGDVVFNIPLDTATLDNTNVTLLCDSNDVALTSLTPSNADMNVTIDFDESDADWMALVGGETCTLTFTTAVTNSLGMPLASPVIYNFSTAP